LKQRLELNNPIPDWTIPAPTALHVNGVKDLNQVFLHKWT
jgi:hypothetical protein